MQTVLLAAGDGAGLEPLSSSNPKPLLPVAGDPLLARTARAAVAAGATSLVVVVPPYHRPFVDALGGTFEGVPVSYAVQPRPTGTARAIAAAKHHLDDDFVVVPGDALFAADDLAPLYESVPSVAVARSATDGVRSTTDDGRSTTDGRTAGAAVVGDGGAVDATELDPGEPGAYAATGACSLPADATEATRVPRNDDGERDLSRVVERVARECGVRSVVVDDYVDVDRPWDLLDATAAALDDWAVDVDGPVVGGRVDDDARLHGAVLVERNATVAAGAVVEGPTVVDEGAYVGASARVGPHSYVGEDVDVAHGASVERSVVMADTSVGHSTTLSDSVVGPAVELGARTTVATLDPGPDPSGPPVDADYRSPPDRPFGVVVGERATTGAGTTLDAGVVIDPHETTGVDADVLADR